MAHLWLCEKCRHLGRPKFKNLDIRYGSEMLPLCEECGSSEITPAVICLRCEKPIKEFQDDRYTELNFGTKDGTHYECNICNECLAEVLEEYLEDENEE